MIHNHAHRLALAAVLAGIASILSGCKPATTPQAPAASTTAADIPLQPALIPAPAKLELGKGHYVVDGRTRVHANNAAAARVAQRFQDFLALAGHAAPSDEADPGKAGIQFLLDDGADTGAEGYLLDVGASGVTIRARDERGLFYGAVSLWQLLTQSSDSRTVLPYLHIQDAPRFPWRGFMLDSARHFQSVDEVKQMIDLLALHKLNTFHWHLTDDQGWRIEIKRYPKLTEVGGCRIPAGDGGIDPQTGKPMPYCGFYTQDQIRDVVKYAADRHITIVPEFDVPGHATAAIAAYPELGVTGEPRVPLSEWGVFSNLFNTEDSTFEFFENVLSEMITLFPGPYVHIGGDEAVKDQWEASPRVQDHMREIGAKDEMAMQSHMVARLEKFLAGHGKRLIGWDEILEGPLPAEATVMSWRGTEGGLKAASEGHDVVMAPVTDMYMDYLQTGSPNEPPGRPAQIPLARVYAFEPVPTTLAADKQQHILGLQATMFTEHSRYIQRVQHNVFPRLAAVAETGWTPAARKDYASFLQRLPVQAERYRELGVAYAKTPFQVDIQTQADAADGKTRISLANPLDYEVRYTTDGSTPSAASVRYEAPFPLTLPATVRAAAFVDGKPLEPANEWNLDATQLLRRTSDTLSTCPDSGKLVLRLEDDGPARGHRAIFNVDIFQPCWRWSDADLAGIGSIRVRAGRIPYYFQLAHDEPNRKFLPASTAHGELQIRSEGCKGPVLASLPMPAETDADGFLTLDLPVPASATGRQDLCFQFTGDTRPRMWVLDEVRLEPRAQP